MQIGHLAKKRKEKKKKGVDSEQKVYYKSHGKYT
jgi:hypothetical protein